MVLPCPPSNNLRHVFNVFISKRGTAPCRCQGDEANWQKAPSGCTISDSTEETATVSQVLRCTPSWLCKSIPYTLDQEEEISYPNPYGFEESPGAPGQEGV